jgi:hypothetical protein
MATFPVDLQGDSRYLPVYSNVLPAAGQRQTTGNFSSHGLTGAYWSSTLYSAEWGYYMLFNSDVVQPDNYLAHSIGMAVRCVLPPPPAPTIDVDPATATFAAAGGTKSDFVVTTTDFTGTPTVVAIDNATSETAAWITSASVSGTTLTVTTAANSATTPRTATLTLTVTNAGGTDTATVTITQEKYVVPAPDGGTPTLAPPGVIGYIAGTNTLTLKGSKEYADATSVDSDSDGIGDIEEYAIDNFGGLENETVYVAYFKFGSLVAISSDPTDNTGTLLEPEDVVAAPDEWKGSLEQARDFIGTTWTNIPVYTSTDYGTTSKRNVSDPSYHNTENFAAAKGDPCMYYFGSDGWKLPTGKPYNGAPDYYRNSESDTNLPWRAVGALGAGLPAGRLSTRAGEAGMFYPAAGYRSYSNGSVNYQGTRGYYWSSTAIDSSYGDRLYFNSSTVLPSNYSYYAFGVSVRCVRPE